MKKPVIEVLKNEFTIHRFQSSQPLPPDVMESSFYWVGKTDEEISVVCDSEIDLRGGERNAGWSCLKVVGPIDFSVVGLLAEISATLASAEISIFALSTFDTDYILVKSVQLEKAKQALGEAGFGV